MSALLSKQKLKLRDSLRVLAEACPIEHCNPEECSLFSLRKLKPRQRSRWLNALKEDDLAFLAAYHYVCYRNKLGETN